MSISTVIRLVLTSVLLVLMWRRYWWVVPLFITFRVIVFEVNKLCEWSTERLKNRKNADKLFTP